VVKVTGGHDTRMSLAALIATRPGQRPRLIYRTHRARRGDKRKGFTETDYARFMDAAHRQLDGPVVLVWDGLNTHTSHAMRELIAARAWLTVFQLPAYAPELNPVEPVWSVLKRSLANLVKVEHNQSPRNGIEGNAPVIKHIMAEHPASVSHAVKAEEAPARSPRWLVAGASSSRQGSASDQYRNGDYQDDHAKADRQIPPQNRCSQNSPRIDDDEVHRFNLLSSSTTVT
jgi:hypothetical protein